MKSVELQQFSVFVGDQMSGSLPDTIWRLPVRHRPKPNMCEAAY